ncbi:MGH1-like glycoside hydrolase domain-containing protein [Luteipulveratus mongoliensis]|uniref:Glucosidase n=1 Tax=Luteipulveratus mongoliensis TaxID=571913 RepID=A0A0K1JKN6_9MICO|nr:glucosidase [Luteipulveratus mongoliensis]AKU17272.1 glucosidase [Luteipulveratus mongoliensis]
MSEPADHLTAEHARLAESPGDLDPWRLWGPYVSGRQWGTVREDYSADGNAWESFPFDHAHTRAYRWGEDGIAGLTDRYGFLNVAVAMWNGQDDRLKERLFGLTNAQGNHGEDAKEYWWHLDATPTHSYAQYLYRYPQAAFPYQQLVEENGRRGFGDDELELADTGILDGNRFFDVTVTHAKANPYDVVVRLEATNHGPDAAPLDLLPHVWFRNTWSWGRDDRRPTIRAVEGGVEIEHDWLGHYRMSASDGARVLLCDNETNVSATFGVEGEDPAHPKDAINRAVVHGDESLLATHVGTKAAFWWHYDAVQPGETVTVTLRLTRDDQGDAGLDGADEIVSGRQADADAFYATVVPADVSDEDRTVARRAFAGLLWCKQLFRYDIRQWLEGDPAQPPPPPERLAAQPKGRNTEWQTLSLADIISMPDEWEYPWFASWDLAFHCVALAHVDPAFAKEQLVLMCREWAMHPNGQLPAYEWNFSDVNPPVHAWAVWRVYQLDGAQDNDFLIRVFSKLMLNFGWWVNRKDSDGSNLFEGGFLGMDNVGPFDRSQPLPDGHRLEQSDATSWMAFFCLNMLRIAWELARVDRAWDEAATKFLEHFLSIAEAMESFGTNNISLWNDEDGFFYDAVVDDDGSGSQVPVRSMVGLLPLMAVAVEPDWVPQELPDYTSRMQWLLKRRPELTDAVVHSEYDGQPDTTLSLLTPERLTRILTRMLDEREFLSPYGIRSLSAIYRDGINIDLEGSSLPIAYAPGEAQSGLFGGNSNWRGPVWFPVNVLLTDALRTYATDLGRELEIEYPTGSGNHVPLREIVTDLEQRLVRMFRAGEDGRRPGDPRHVPTGDLWQAHPTFSEYFHGDTGAGLGASHQTGWTAMVAHLICHPAEHE